MKIGILTIHTAFNYGAMLQAYSLQMALTKLGYKTLILDYYPKELERRNYLRPIPSNPKQIIKYLYARFNPNVQKKIRRFNEFRNQMLLTRRYYDKAELYQNPPDFDLFILGSDQVWNMEHGFNSFLFLDFVKTNNKISYASSFGTAAIPKEYSEKLKTHLEGFKAISVRESDGVKIIKEATGLKAIRVLDPTFLLSPEEWTQLAAKRQFPGDYILAYGFSNSKEFNLLIKTVQEKYKLPLIAVTSSAHYPYTVDKCFMDSGPLEFLALFRDAKVICTDSFHGLAYSIHFRKTFFTIPHRVRNSRLDNLLSLLNLKSREFSNPLDILKLTDSELSIDYHELEPVLKENIESSLNYLVENLK
jgi:hypothetical protein